MNEEHIEHGKWYSNPVRKANIATMVTAFLICTAAGLIFVITEGLLYIPLLLFMSIGSGTVMLHTIRLETKIRPRFVAISPDGMLFRYADGSEQLNSWGEITDIGMAEGDMTFRKMGYIRIINSRGYIPIPYEAFEEALVMRKTREISRV